MGRCFLGAWLASLCDLASGMLWTPPAPVGVWCLAGPGGLFFSPTWGSCSTVHRALLLPLTQAAQLDLGSADCVIVVGFGLSYLEQAGLWALGALWVWAQLCWDFWPSAWGRHPLCAPAGSSLGSVCWVVFLVCALGFFVFWGFTGCFGSPLRSPAMPYVQEHTQTHKHNNIHTGTVIQKKILITVNGYFHSFSYRCQCKCLYFGCCCFFLTAMAKADAGASVDSIAVVVVVFCSLPSCCLPQLLFHFSSYPLHAVLLLWPCQFNKDHRGKSM